MPKIRRALLTVSDKERIGELAKALHQSGAEVVATGRTAKVVEEAGVPIVPIEKISGSPEAFQGRMKTLSFPVCSGILYRRDDDSDEVDLKKLGIAPIDCVVVNFYPFEKAAAKEGIQKAELIEEIDIGGPTLVRSAAKNAPATLVLTDPSQYHRVIQELGESGEVSDQTSEDFAKDAWDRIADYDWAIQERLGGGNRLSLRYGENPHQGGFLDVQRDAPIDWSNPLTEQSLSYNNILDLSSAYHLATELKQNFSDSTSVVIVKHNNPCGVAVMPKGEQLKALQRAWEGDPVSAFGGVLVFTDPVSEESATWLRDRFVECVAAPDWSESSDSLKELLVKRKRLKAVTIRRFESDASHSVVRVPGGILRQSPDSGLSEEFVSKTKVEFDSDKRKLAEFGVLVCRALKSNAITLVREIPGATGSFQLVGAGQGQPNRIEALKALAVPRAKSVLNEVGGELSDCVMISDAFFPFRDTVDTAHENGIRWIVQPGGSLKDQDSVDACNEHGIGMVFTGTRHFKH